jgi:hypothetical protein
MREIKKYQAIDGTMWDSEEECLYHEKQDVKQMYEWAMKIKSYCKDMTKCTGCPFDCDGDCLLVDVLYPADWAIDEFKSDE